MLILHMEACREAKLLAQSHTAKLGPDQGLKPSCLTTEMCS